MGKAGDACCIQIRMLNLSKGVSVHSPRAQEDRREYHLMLTEKYLRYRGLLSSYEQTVMQRIEARIPPEDVQKFDEILRIMSGELMPECDKQERKIEHE